MHDGCLACGGFGTVLRQHHFMPCEQCDGHGYLKPTLRKQSRAWSLGETVFSTAIGFVVAMLTQIVVFPWFGLYVSWAQDFTIAAIFTVVSIARGYCVRRLFEGLR